MDLEKVKDINDLPMAVKNIGDSQFGGLVTYKTLVECKDAYINAPKIVENIAKHAVTVIRANALIHAKEQIMGKVRSRESLKKVSQDLVDAWYKFLDELELLKDGRESVDVRELMKFARVRETAHLKGLKIIAPNSGQMRYLNKVLGTRKKPLTDIQSAVMYESLAKKYNKGEVFKSRKDVELAAVRYLEERLDAIKEQPKPTPQPIPPIEVKTEPLVTKALLVELYREDNPTPQQPLTTMQLSSEFMKTIPTPDKALWKKLYRECASVLHPDKGGSEELMSILSTLNEAYQLLYTNQKTKATFDSWGGDLFDEWKKDNGYDADLGLYDTIEIETEEF